MTSFDKAVDEPSDAEVPAPVPKPPQVWLTQKQREGLTRWISRMRVVRPELVRAVFTHQALYWAGSALRGGGVPKLKRMYQMSRACETIDEFWSHSWQLGAYRKILCLLFLKNGLAASVIGTLTAVVTAVLLYFNLVTEIRILRIPFSCTIAGTISATLTLFFWRSSARVFLDVCCIDQVDPKNKTEGIVSLGGILRSSRSLVILWDRTWVERLWCVFELAAFLHRGGNPRVVIHSTLLGPCALATFMAIPIMGLLWAALHEYQGLNILVMLVVICLTFYVAIAAFRSYHHSIETFHEQLRNFSLGQTKCRCCAANHAGPNGAVLPCDREIVERCIVDWFGGVQQFEDATIPLLRSTFDKQLGQHIVPYSYFLVVFSPVLWTGMDLSTSLCEGAKHTCDDSLAHWPVFWQFQFLGFWLGLLPILAKVTLYLSSYFSRPRRFLLCDVLLNLLIVAVVKAGFFVGLLLAHLLDSNYPRAAWLDNLTTDWTLRAFILFASYCVPSALLWLVPEAIRIVQARRATPAVDQTAAV